ncbi:MAG: hypothetical protein H6581_29795 [Bacteroidia bacterium]|nr:hypothetical protein [Bacteroidia bacterium]
MKRLFHPLFIAFLLLLIGQSCHPFDKSQVPQITVQPGLVPVFSFSPETAFRIRVFKGDKDLDTYGDELMWELTGVGAENSLQSPITYGIGPEDYHQDRPAKPLQAGETYTVVIMRMDPKASGDGFTRRSNDYRASATFLAQ